MDGAAGGGCFVPQSKEAPKAQQMRAACPGLAPAWPSSLPPPCQAPPRPPHHARHPQLFCLLLTKTTRRYRGILPFAPSNWGSSFFSPSPLVGGDFFFSFWRKDAIRGPCMHAVGCSSHGRDRGLWGTDTAIDSQDGCVSHSLMCRVSRFAVVLAVSGSGGRGGSVVLVLASNCCQPTSRVGGISAARPGYRPTGQLTWLSRFISAGCPNISEL